MFFECDRFKYRIFQYLAALGANFGILSVGLHYGWTSSSIPNLISGNYTIHISNEDGSWLASMVPMGSIVGDILAASILNIFGRKRLILLSALPLSLTWVMLDIASSPTYLFIARFIAGIMDGILFTAIPAYLAEISDPEIRGLMCSSYPVTLVFGMLLMNIIQYYLSMKTAIYFSAIISLATYLVIPWIPETPYFYMMKDDMEGAKKSLQKFRGSGDVDTEMLRISKGLMEKRNLKEKFHDLFCKSSNRKALLVAAGFTVMQQCSGIIVILSYSTTVFEECKDFIQPEVANILFFTAFFAISTLALLIVDITGRKVLLTISLILTMSMLFTNAGYLYVKTHTDVNTTGLSYISFASILLYTITFSIGLNTIPLLVISEIFPPYLKGMGICISNLVFSFVSTIVLKYYTWSTENYGTFVPFATYGFFCILSLFFVIFFVPETKGKTLEDIQAELGVDVKVANTEKII